MKKYGKELGIADYKFDNTTEKILGWMADHSAFGIKIYVLFYRIFDKKYYLGGLPMINRTIDIFKGIIPEGMRKKYIQDMIYSLHRFGCMFDEYFLFGFEYKNVQGRLSYVTDKKSYEYYHMLNTIKGKELFDDKYKTYQVFHQFYNREVVVINNEDDHKIFVNFLRRKEHIISKPYNSCQGRNIEFINYHNDSESLKAFQHLKEKYNNMPYICEEVICQSKTMASLHPDSINTIRITTIRNNGNIYVLHPLLRFGVGKAKVDNAGQGGFFALIDENSGIVYTEAKDEKGHSFVLHPDSGTVIPGFRIPQWQEALVLVRKLAQQNKETKYVGWDLAHTDNGWIMVEGNAGAQLLMQQVFFSEGFKKEMDNNIVKKKQ